VALCREMTKTFEEVITGTLAELAERIAAAALKGEIVVVIAPPAQADAASDSDVDALLVQLAQSMKPSAAAAEASRLTGRPKPDLYKRLLELKSDA
jgi:16S rRNA (cytidine1402-2'-O)-methyltransferase